MSNPNNSKSSSLGAVRAALALVAAAKAAGDAAKAAWKVAFGGEPHVGVPHPDADDYAAAKAAAVNFYAAKAAADDATAAAAEAVGALPWGAHGAYFVTRRRSVGCIDMRVDVAANRRPIVAVYADGRGEPFRFVDLPNAPARGSRGVAAHAAQKSAADALRAGLRALPVAVQDRVAAAYYDGAEGDIPLGGGWCYSPGQEGGTVALLPVWVPTQTEVEWGGIWGPRPAPEMRRGAGRAVREVILLASRQRQLAREAVAEVRALRISFGDRAF